MVDTIDAAMRSLPFNGVDVIGPATFDVDKVEEPRAVGVLIKHADGEEARTLSPRRPVALARSTCGRHVRDPQGAYSLVKDRLRRRTSSVRIVSREYAQATVPPGADGDRSGNVNEVLPV